MPDTWSGGEEIWGKNYLAAMVRRLHSSGVIVQTRHPRAVLAEQAIASYAKQHPQVQLIALTTHGRNVIGRALQGSVAEQAFAAVPTSLLLLHPPEGGHPTSGPIVRTTYQTIIVLLDGSSGAEQRCTRQQSLQACAMPPLFWSLCQHVLERR